MEFRVWGKGEGHFGQGRRVWVPSPPQKLLYCLTPREGESNYSNAGARLIFDQFPNPREDLESRSRNLGPFTTKATL